MPATKTVQHTGLAGSTMLCNRCGARQELTLPQPMDSVAALLKAWAKAHKKCVGDRRAFRDATSIHDWRASDDTGLSSIAIYQHMRGEQVEKDSFDRSTPYPHDPGDFGRCHRLLALSSAWRARIGEMAKYGKVWAALVAVWDELDALYLEELPAGTCPKLYARMKELGT